jgi:hypothetical protein
VDDKLDISGKARVAKEKVAAADAKIGASEKIRDIADDGTVRQKKGLPFVKHSRTNVLPTAVPARM